MKVQDLSARHLKRLTEENKITWLLYMHGIRTICTDSAYSDATPASRNDTCPVNKDNCSSVTESEATFIDQFMTESVFHFWKYVSILVS